EADKAVARDKAVADKSVATDKAVADKAVAADEAVAGEIAVESRTLETRGGSHGCAAEAGAAEAAATTAKAGAAAEAGATAAEAAATTTAAEATTTAPEATPPPPGTAPPTARAPPRGAAAPRARATTPPPPRARARGPPPATIAVLNIACLLHADRSALRSEGSLLMRITPPSDRDGMTVVSGFAGARRHSPTVLVAVMRVSGHRSLPGLGAPPRGPRGANTHN